ncbi:MAG: sodium/proline symporter [Clostridia bacterium]|nr:sodium/proline symporter [Clostridia bacterium]
MTTTNIFIMIAIVVYLAAMVIVGAICSKRNKNTDDFYLGGRKLGPLVTAMSAEASDMSSWLLMGLPAVALMTGLPEATWTAVGLAIGTYINWLIVAKRIRLYSQKLNAVTLPDFFSKRFGDDKKIITLIASVFIIIFFIPYTASGFAACGKLFSSLFGVDYVAALVISALVIVIYCTLGGFLAASTTDLIQSIIMTIALIIVLGVGLTKSGGLENVLNNVRGLDGYLDLFKGHDVASGATLSYGGLPVASTLAWGLGYFGMPHILLRFMAIEDEKKLKLSRRIASIWVVISMAIAVFIGVIGYSLMKNGIVGPYSDSSSAETIIVDIAKFIAEYNWLAAIIGGLILAGILASTMSTADSQLLAAASSISQNLVQETFGIKLSEKKSMLLARISVLAISVVGVLLALDPNSSVFRIVSFAWGGFGAVFGPVVLFALFWKRTTKVGVISGMVTGGAMIFIWKFIVRVQFAGSILDIYELLPAFILSSIVIWLVSLATKAPNADVTKTFDEIKAECSK